MPLVLHQYELHLFELMDRKKSLMLLAIIFYGKNGSMIILYGVIWNILNEFINTFDLDFY